MSLQYRTRDMSSDRDWQHRVRLSLHLVMEIVDCWCREDGDFPVERTIAAILHIFSPRCDTSRTPDVGLQQYLFSMVDTPHNEFRKTWPNRTESCSLILINALRQIIDDAVLQWSSGSMLTPAIESVNAQLAETLVTQQFVVFHHYQTTSRDVGGFHSQG